MFFDLWSYPYFRWHFLFTILPTILLWLFWSNYLLKYKKTILLMAFCGFLYGIIWDFLGSVLFHLWFYDGTKHIGLPLAGLPWGEYIYMLLIPQEFTALILIARKYILK